MEIRHLYYLREVALQKSYTKAANSLHISQSNLSQQISNLEKELGFHIFVHSKRSVILTPAGKRFLSESESVIAEWENLLISSGKFVQNNKIALILAMYPAMKYTSIVSLANTYIKDHPNIVPEFKIMPEDDVLISLKSGNCNIGFFEDAYSSIDDPSFREKQDNLLLTPIYNDSVAIIMNERDPMANSAIIRKGQLKDYRIICKKTGSKFTYDRIRKIFLEVGVDINHPFALADDLNVMASLLNEPNRIVFVNFSVGLNLVQQNPHLRCIRLDTPKKVVSYMAMRKEDIDNPTTRSFFNFVKDKINYTSKT